METSTAPDGATRAADTGDAPSARSAVTSASAAESTGSIAAVRDYADSNGSGNNGSHNSSGSTSNGPAKQSSGSHGEGDERAAAHGGEEQEEEHEGGEGDDDDESHMSHCNKCKKSEDGDELLLCENCPRAFHLACLGYGAVPDITWYCDHCLAKKKRGEEKAAAKQALRVAKEAAKAEEKQKKAAAKEAEKLAKEVEKRKKALEKEAKEAAKGTPSTGKKRKARHGEGQGGEEAGSSASGNDSASTPSETEGETKGKGRGSSKGKTPQKEAASTGKGKGKGKGGDDGPGAVEWEAEGSSAPPKAKKSKVAAEGGEGAAQGKAAKTKPAAKDSGPEAATAAEPPSAPGSSAGGGLLSTLAGKVGSTGAKGLAGLHAPSPRAAEKAVGPAGSSSAPVQAGTVPALPGNSAQAIALLLAPRAQVAAASSTVTAEQRQALENMIHNVARQQQMMTAARAQHAGLGSLGKPHPSSAAGAWAGAGAGAGVEQSQEQGVEQKSEPETEASIPLGLAISMFISAQKQADAEAAQKAHAIEQALAAQTAAAAGGAAPPPQPLEHKPREVASLYARSRTVENTWAEMVKKAAHRAAVLSGAKAGVGGSGAAPGPSVGSAESDDLEVVSVEGPALPVPLPGLEQKALADVQCPVYAGHGHYSVVKSCNSILACLGKVEWTNVTFNVMPVELRAFGLTPAYRGEPAAQPSVRQAMAATLLEQDAKAAAASAAGKGAVAGQQQPQAAQRSFPIPDEEVMGLPPATSSSTAGEASSPAAAPAEPSFTRDTLGLPDALLGDLLPLWDFIRTFTRAHAAGVPPLLRTGPMETGEALITTEKWFGGGQAGTLAPEVEAVARELGLTGKTPPLPCPDLAPIPQAVAADLADKAAAVASSDGAVPPLQSLLPDLGVDPATVSLPDLLVALSSPSFRAYRLLSRLHVAMLKFLLKDRDTTLEHQRGGAAGGGAGAGEDEEEEGGGGKAQSSKIGRTSRTLQDEIGASYEARLGDREREQDPMLGQLNVLTWPEVLRRSFCYGPLSAYLRPHLTARSMAIVDSLTHLPYASLCMTDRLALLKGLMDAVTATDSFGNYCNGVVGERVHVLTLELEEDMKRLGEDRDAEIGKERSKAQAKVRHFKDVLDANQQAKVKKLAASAGAKLAEGGKTGSGSSSADNLDSLLSASSPEEDSLDEGTWSEVVTARLEAAGLSRVEVRTQLALALKQRNVRLAQEKDAAAKKAAVSELSACLSSGDIAALGLVLRRVTQSGLGLEGKLPPSALPERPAKGRPPKVKEEAAGPPPLPVGMDDVYAHAQIRYLSATSQQRVQQLVESYAQRMQSVRARYSAKVDNMRLSAILLGSDRYNRSYWVLNADRGCIWVECPVDTSGRPLAGAPSVPAAVPAHPHGHGPTLPSQAVVQEARLDLKSCGLDAGLALANLTVHGGSTSSAGGVGAGMGESAMDGSDSPAAFGAGAGTGGASLLGLQAGRGVGEAGQEGAGDQGGQAQGVQGQVVGGKKRTGRIPLDVEAHRSRVAAEYTRAQLQSSYLLAVHGPEAEDSRWLCLDSIEQVTSLLLWLDPRGHREKALSMEVQRYMSMFQTHMPPTHASAAYLRAARTALLRAHPGLSSAVQQAQARKGALLLEDAEREKQAAASALTDAVAPSEGTEGVEGTANAPTGGAEQEDTADGTLAPSAAAPTEAMDVEQEGEAGGAGDSKAGQATLEDFFPPGSAPGDASRPKRAAAKDAAARVFATSSLGVAQSRAAASSSASAPSSSSSGAPALPLTPLQQAQRDLEELRVTVATFEEDRQAALDPAAKSKGKRGGGRGSRELSNLQAYGMPSKASAAATAAAKRQKDREVAENAAKPVDAAPATAVLLQSCKRQLLDLESKLERGVLHADSKHPKVLGGCSWYRADCKGEREGWRDRVAKAKTVVDISTCVLQLEGALFGLQRIRRVRLGLVKGKQEEEAATSTSAGPAAAAAGAGEAELDADAPASSPTADPPAPSSAARAARGGGRGRGGGDTGKDEEEEEEEVEEVEEEGEEGDEVEEVDAGVGAQAAGATATSSAAHSGSAADAPPSSSTTPAALAVPTQAGAKASGGKIGGKSKGRKKGSALDGIPTVSAPKLQPFNAAHEYGWSDGEDGELPILHPTTATATARAGPAHPIIVPPSFTTAGRRTSVSPEDSHVFDDVDTTALARDRHGAWARLKPELLNIGVQPDKLVATLWTGPVDAEHSNGAAASASQPAPAHFNSAVPYARAVRPEAYCDPVTGAPVEPLARILQGPKAGPTLLSPVFPWAPAGTASAGGSTEAGVDAEIPEATTLQVGIAHVREQNKGMLWTHRSSRRWWRLRVRWCTSLHALCLLLIELHEVSAGAGLVEPPVTLLWQFGPDGGEGEGEGGEVVELSSEDEDGEEEEGGGPAGKRGGKKASARDDSDSFAQGEATDTEDEGVPGARDGQGGKGGRGGTGGKGGNRAAAAAEDEELSVTEDEDEDGAPRRAGGKHARTVSASKSSKTGKRKAAVAQLDAMDDERDSEADEEDEQQEAMLEEDDHDDTCIACGAGSSEGDPGTDPLLMCEGCTTVCHLTCAGERKVPRGNWFCSACKAKPCLTCGKPVESAKAAHCGVDTRTARQRGKAGGGEGSRKKAKTVDSASGGGCGAVYHCTCVFLKEPPAQTDWLCPRCSKKY